ncbi:ankyrin repeats (3 copies) domain-containing protein [Purpureocillium lilacinum]|uniref:Ankyrin repeats (3 copies) domain-containing protein n=1 Tax=Purpureocillium lilacinum TaxID=33203 RepID=A0A179GKH2_PURLI|nr:ankyrin repeats (3 copies) domain-containing protein [Purpureocillium lilacinum]
MKLLLATPGIHVNPRDSKGRTPLSWTAGMGCADHISLLLASDGIHADAGDKGSRRPLWWAAALGRPAAVRLLLNSQQVTVDATDSSGQTALVAAAAGLGDECDVGECVQLLLAAGARPDAKTIANRTPLSWAAGTGKLGVFKLVLVAMGHWRFETWTVQDWVTARERDEMVKLLLGGSGTSRILYSFSTVASLREEEEGAYIKSSCVIGAKESMPRISKVNPIGLDNIIAGECSYIRQDER